MPKYSKQFKEEALAHMKKVGISQTCKDLKIARCTLYKWCHMQEGIPSNTNPDEETMDKETPMLPEDGELLPVSDEPCDEEEAPAPSDSVATAMAMLVIENMELRATIRQLRSTISGLTDRML